MTSTTSSRPARVLPRLALAAACLGLVAVPVATPAPAAAAVAQAARELKLQVPAGTSFGFGQVTDVTMDMKIAAGENNMNMTLAANNTVAGTAEVLEVGADGLPTKVRFTFDPTSGTQVQMMGQNQQEPFELAGKTATLTMNAGGEPALDPPAGEETLETLVSLFDFNQSLMPDRPVTVGESWQAEDANPMGGVGGEAGGTTTVTLVGYRDVGGREAAELRLQGNLDGEMEGMTSRGQVGGTTLVDAQTGLIVGGQITGDLTVSGNDFQGMQAQVDGDLDLNVSYNGSVNGAGGGMVAGAGVDQPAAPDVPSFPPAPSADGDPATPATPAAPAGDLLTGEYEGDGLKLVVGDPAGSTYPVTILKGTATYQGTITSTVGDSFSGSFTAGGNPFPFSGTRTPAGLSFQTGTSTYNLTGSKAEQPANPL